MENKKLGQEPAYPCNSPDGEESYKGMSKRFYAACAAMQGILASKYGMCPEHVIELAYQYADELLKQEEVK